jgi:hypothetical protein
MTGFLDEGRLARVARSAEWIATELANQRDPRPGTAAVTHARRDAHRRTLSMTSSPRNLRRISIRQVLFANAIGCRPAPSSSARSGAS